MKPGFRSNRSIGPRYAEHIEPFGARLFPECRLDCRRI